MRARLLSRLLALTASSLSALFLAALLWQSARSAVPAEISRLTSTTANQTILINEVDAVTSDRDIAEFIELYDGGQGSTALDGLVLVLFNGQDDSSYAAFDLEGRQTSAAGYFLLANQGVPGVDLIFADSLLQNGVDAVALYQGTTAEFPLGTAVTTTNLIDAVVYGVGGEDDLGLLALLEPNQPQVDENSQTLAEFQSNQRCPNGGGQPRQTQSYNQALPTPKTANACPDDHAPAVSATYPVSGGIGVAVDSSLILTFSEPVAVGENWFALACSASGPHTATVSGTDTMFILDPLVDFSQGENCSLTVLADLISDLDNADPPDGMATDFDLTFSIVPTSPLIINEVDADTPGDDAAEFIEISGPANTSLEGLVLVLFNGSDDLSYKTIDLAPYAITETGYFVVGNTAVANVDLIIADGTLQNGADAVALYAGSAAGFPNGTPVSTHNLVDAFVYGTADADDPGLLPLLLAGEPQVDESNRENAAGDSNQRCPDSQGGQRRSSSYLQNLPTPGRTNKCSFDSAPEVSGTSPENEAAAVPLSATITITFSEPVTATEGWFQIACSASGMHEAAVTANGARHTLNPSTDFIAGESCSVTVLGDKVQDTDNDDPPDFMAGDYIWSFETIEPPPPEVHLIINEVDADTDGSDTAEFIELANLDPEMADLSGFVLVLYNGETDTSYAAVDLDSSQIAAHGYFVVGNEAVANNNLVIPNGLIQNGADAVALFIGSAADFPSGTAVTTTNLVDAIVYGTDDTADPGLLSLLLEDEPQVNENSRSNAVNDSNQRCPDRTGGERRTSTYLQNLPTPGASNKCTFDDGPEIVAVSPINGAAGVPIDATITVTFSEPVTVSQGWFDLACTSSGSHQATTTGSSAHYTLNPTREFSNGELCTTTIFAAKIQDQDQDDPPDTLASDFQWSFTTSPEPTADNVLINEVDADTVGTDQAEFIELTAVGEGATNLTGLVVVLFNGNDDQSYKAIDLDGGQIADSDYFIIGNAALNGVDLTIPDGSIQNGADAVALYAGSAADFPNGTPVTTENLIDAIVYGPDGSVDDGLMPLLLDGEPQVNEDGRSNAASDSNQRCPDRGGGQRRTSTYLQNLPTPGTENKCTFDEAPQVIGTSPDNNSIDVALDAAISIQFSEAVTVTPGWFEIECQIGGKQEAAVTGNDAMYTLTPEPAFSAGDSCTVTLSASKISDLDIDDPPDTMVSDYQWTYSTISPPPADFVLINELDADTPGADQAEFIELYNGGVGQTALDGLVIALYNGANDLSYASIGLSGYSTDNQGYFLLGNQNVPGVDLVFGQGLLQNGTDAVALYAGSAVDFPNGTAVTTDGLLDAVVYGSASTADSDLLSLMIPGEPQVDEDSRANREGDSNQRCPNGAGGKRRTSTYVQNLPTPGGSNKCTFDEAPRVIGTTPENGMIDVALDAAISIKFSEAVTVAPDWFEIDCQIGGKQGAAVTGNDTAYKLTPEPMFAAGDSCTVRLSAAKISDEDNDDPPNMMAGDYQWTFYTIAPPVADFVLINELDADTPGADQAEFIELYDSGVGSTALDGLVIVLYTGANDLSYRSIDLDGYKSDSQGYFLLGNQDVPGVDLVFGQGVLQNGADAVALYAGSAADFPNGTAVTTDGLLDALVYGTADSADPGLLALMLPGQPQVDEDSRANSAGDSNQRCPNGSGGQRMSAAYLQNGPTPGASNQCAFDSAPEVTGTEPQNGASEVAVDTAITVNFSEPVAVQDGWATISCDRSGSHLASTNGTNTSYTLDPIEDFSTGEICNVIISADLVSDADQDDPPDSLNSDFQWQFSTASPPAATHIVINEVDADTPGVDQLEFIELFDGGSGSTALDGLVLVLFNGADDKSYRAVDLDGYKTGKEGYFVAGNEEVAGVDFLFGNGTLQNGPDAVALYVGSESDFANGTPITTDNLIDALVYGTADDPDPGLLSLLGYGQPQVNEAGGGSQELHSNQRCPNGAGGQRISSGFLQNPATPGETNDCTMDVPPQVTGTLPLSGALGIDLDSSITISFSEAVQVQEPWINLSCSASGDHTGQVSGGPANYIFDPDMDFAAREWCAATVLAGQASDLDKLPDPLPADYSWSFQTGIPSLGACGDPATPIHLIQGSGLTTTLSQTQAIIVEGVVTGDFQGPDKLGGFFLQEASGLEDGDPQTSEGIFVYDGSLNTDVSSMEKVRLQGDILEINGMTSISNVVDLQRCGLDLTLVPTLATLPISDVSTWENMEGMLIRIDQPLAATGLAGLGSTGTVELALGAPLLYPTEFAAPGTAAEEAAELNRRSKITLDDGSRQTPVPRPPYLHPGGTLRVGDTLDHLTGILTEDENGYQIQPTEPVSFTHNNQRPQAPPPGSHLRLVHFDAGGYFNGDGMGDGFPGAGGAQTAEEFGRQRAKIINALLAMQADLLALSGIENDGYDQTSAIYDLLQGLNEVTEGAPFALIDPSLPQLGEAETAAAIIYRADRLQPQGLAVTTNGSPFDGPGSQPLAQRFIDLDSGETFVAAAVQFPGRGNCSAEGDANADQGDGQGCFALLRSQMASALVEWLAGDSALGAAKDVIILGSLNSYHQEDALAELLDAGFVDLAAQFPSAGDYTSVRAGQVGTLNYALASPALAAQVQETRVWPINAAEPGAFDYHTSNQPMLYDPGPYRSAELDPLIIDLDLDHLVARFTTDSPQRVGRPIQFQNMSRGPGINGYEWDFGDGSPVATTENSQHNYLAVGHYQVVLKVQTSWGETRYYSAPVRVLPAQLFLPFLPFSQPASGS